MTATMVRQGGRVQLEQSDMRLVLKMAKMATEGLSRATIEETKYLIWNHRAMVREEMKRGVEFPEHKTVQAAIERHLALLCQNHMSGCLPCHNGTAKNPLTCWRPKGTGGPPPNWRRQPTPELTPPLPGMPPAPAGNTSGPQRSQIVNLPAWYTYSHTGFPSAELFDHNASD